MNEKIGLLGGGGQADEIIESAEGKVSFVAVTKDYVREGLVDIEHPDEELKMLPVISSVGAPTLRKKFIELWPGKHYGTLFAKNATVASNTMIGEGCYIGPSTVITTNVDIGNHTLVNVAATVQHDSIIGQYCTIGPNVSIGGNVTMGDGVFVGIGAVVANDVTIANGVVIGAGAVVPPHTRLDTENGVYVGVPAKLIKQNEGWLSDV